MMELGGNVIGFSDAMNSSVSKGRDRGRHHKSDQLFRRHNRDASFRGRCSACRRPQFPYSGDKCRRRVPCPPYADSHRSADHPPRTRPSRQSHCRFLRVILKFGRTVHSLIKALARFKGIRIVLIAPEQLRLPELHARGCLRQVRHGLS